MRIRLLLVSLVLAVLLVSPAHVGAGEPLDLNSAPAAELMKLPGVGPARAGEIIRFRLVHGFRRKADLLRIRGIGRRTYIKLKPLVQVRPVREPKKVVEVKK